MKSTISPRSCTRHGSCTARAWAALPRPCTGHGTAQSRPVNAQRIEEAQHCRGGRAGEHLGRLESRRVHGGARRKGPVSGGAYPQQQGGRPDLPCIVLRCIAGKAAGSAVKGGRTMKTYQVTYFIKAGQRRGCEVKETMTVEAANSKGDLYGLCGTGQAADRPPRIQAPRPAGQRLTRRKGRQQPRTAAGEQGAYRPRPLALDFLHRTVNIFSRKAAGGECPRRATWRPLLSSADLHTRIFERGLRYEN